MGIAIEKSNFLASVTNFLSACKTKTGLLFTKIGSYTVSLIQAIPPNLAKLGVSKSVLLAYSGGNIASFIGSSILANKINHLIHSHVNFFPAKIKNGAKYVSDGLIVGGASYSANYILAKMTSIPLSKRNLILIVIGTIALHQLFFKGKRETSNPPRLSPPKITETNDDTSDIANKSKIKENDPIKKEVKDNKINLSHEINKENSDFQKDKKDDRPQTSFTETKTSILNDLNLKLPTNSNSTSNSSTEEKHDTHPHNKLSPRHSEEHNQVRNKWVDPKTHTNWSRNHKNLKKEYNDSTQNLNDLEANDNKSDDSTNSPPPKLKKNHKSINNDQK